MDKMHDFTFDPQNFSTLPFYINNFHKKKKKYVIILDPAIASRPDKEYKALNQGLEMNIFISDEHGKPIEGSVWPGPTYFPDFTHPNIS